MRKSLPPSVFIRAHLWLILFDSHAASFGALATLATVACPAAPAPKLTVNCAAVPVAVDRAAITWYVTHATPDGTVASTNDRLPQLPTVRNGPVPVPTR